MYKVKITTLFNAFQVVGEATNQQHAQYDVAVELRSLQLSPLWALMARYKRNDEFNGIEGNLLRTADYEANDHVQQQQYDH